MKNLAFNKSWFIYVTSFAILIVLGILTFDEDFWTSVSVIAISAVLIIGYLIFMPLLYRFDQNKITVYYGCGVKTSADWSMISHIDDCPAKKSLLPWSRVYEIGYFDTKFPFWEETFVPKNRKTKKLIEAYYKKSIQKLG